VRNCAALVWVLVRFFDQLDVEYLPVYRPNPQEIADPDLYAHNVQQVAKWRPSSLLLLLLAFALSALRSR
jgi:hypothetical protein